LTPRRGRRDGEVVSRFPCRAGASRACLERKDSGTRPTLNLPAVGPGPGSNTLTCGRPPQGAPSRDLPRGPHGTYPGRLSDRSTETISATHYCWYDKGSASIPERISTRYSSGIHLLMISLRIMKSHDQPINRSVLNWRTDHANGDFVLGLDDSLAHFRNSFRVNWVGVGLLGWPCSYFRSLCPIGLEVFREPNPGVSYDARRDWEATQS
jgi:hypothetical protein